MNSCLLQSILETLDNLFACGRNYIHLLPNSLATICILAFMRKLSSFRWPGVFLSGLMVALTSRLEIYWVLINILNVICVLNVIDVWVNLLIYKVHRNCLRLHLTLSLIYTTYWVLASLHLLLQLKTRLKVSTLMVYMKLRTLTSFFWYLFHWTLSLIHLIFSLFCILVNS